MLIKLIKLEKNVVKIGLFASMVQSFNKCCSQEQRNGRNTYF